MSLSLLQNKASGKEKVVRLNGRPPDRGVCSILSTDHGLDARPGQSDLTCPFCGHKTFSVKGDDLVAKCFYPACGRFITPYRGRDLSGLYRVHEEIFRLCHAELLQKRDSEAWDYLAEVRQVHPHVIELAPLGMVPANFQAVVSGMFGQLLEEARARAEESKSNRPGRWSSAATEAANQVKAVEEAKGKAEKCFRDNAGWLCFFYRDERNRVTSIKFRKPGTKARFYYKPFQRAGLFGAEVWTPFEGNGAAQENRLSVTEGEFNALQLWSAAARYADSLGKDTKFHRACATGGSSGCDWGAIRALCPTPLIWRDGDDAGCTMVASASETMTVDVIVSPVDGQDPDEFIKAAGPDPGTTWQAIRDLFQKKKTVYRTFNGIAAEIYSCRQKQEKDRRREFEINSEVAALVKADLLERGTFYRSRDALFYFSHESKKLIPLDEAAPDFIIMMGWYGLNRIESPYKYTAAELFKEALQNGQEIDVQRMAYYDRETFSLYIPNHAGQIYRITSNEIRLVDNGTDGILFLDDPDSESFSYDPALLEDRESPLRGHIVSQMNLKDDTQTGLTVEDQQKLFSFWIYSLFFESIMPTKPIVALWGEKGSWKTYTLKKLLRAIFGPQRNVIKIGNDPKDLESALTNNSFLVVDQVEKYYDWLEDLLAIASTSGNLSRRRYFTTNENVNYPLRCSVAITTRTSPFRRDDVADRVLIFRTYRVEKSFESEAEMTAALLRDRDAIMTDLIQDLQDVVSALEKSADTKEVCDFRMADFSAFCLKIARAVGEDELARVRQIFESLAKGQVIFSLEEEPTVELMQMWANEWTDDTRNSDRWVTNMDLFNELTALSKQHGLAFEDKDKPRKFAWRMTSLRPQIGKLYFDIDERSRGGHVKTYRYRPMEHNMESGT